MHAASDRRLYDVLSTSMAARQQPLFLVISTAGYDRHSILWELYAHAKKVQENPALDPTFLPILYEAPAGRGLDLKAGLAEGESGAGRFSQPRGDGDPSGAGEGDSGAGEHVSPAVSEPVDGAGVAVDRDAGLGCLPGADRPGDAARPKVLRRDGLEYRPTDLTALVAVFPRVDGCDVLPQFFIPQDRIRTRGMRDHVPYDEWMRRGQLTATPGATVDYEAVRQVLTAWAADYDVQLIAYDPWNATDLVSRLEKQDSLPCVAMRQTYAALSAPTKSLEKAILGRTLRHDGHPVLRWNVSNVAVESDASGNLKPSKVASTERIDGVVALIMAVDLMDRHARTPAAQYAMTVIG